MSERSEKKIKNVKAKQGRFGLFTHCVQIVLPACHRRTCFMIKNMSFWKEINATTSEIKVAKLLETVKPDSSWFIRM